MLRRRSVGVNRSLHGNAAVQKQHFSTSLKPCQIILRDYQEQAVKSVHSAIARGIRRPAVVLATGGGKTVVFGHLIQELVPTTKSRGNKTLVLAHKEELVIQAANTISSMYPHLKVEIDMRHLKPSEGANIIVGSIPTLIRTSRLEKYNPQDFKAIVLDECHHATASSWIKVLKYFEADTSELEIYVLGFTATLERTDGLNLGQIFDEIVYERSLLEMVKNKELVDVKFSSIDINIDFSEVASRKDDYQITSLSQVMNKADVNSVVALSYMKLQKDFGFRSTLIFCVDINHCKTLCGELQNQGVNAQYVTGETSKHERRSIVEDFKNGTINVLCNVQVFTEGTDIPNIDSLFLARPTKSRVLLVQMIGRGLRLSEGKSHCHVIDIAGTKGTGIQSVPTLFSLPPDYIIDGKTFQQLEKEKGKYELQREEIKKEFLLQQQHKKLKEMQKQIRELFSIEDIMQNVSFSVSTYNGFMALDNDTRKKYRLFEVIKKEFASSRVPWVRLEYDVWGFQTKNDSFILVRKLEESGGPVWELTLNKFASNYQMVSSQFMCPRHRLVAELAKSPNLEEVLIEAEHCQSRIDKEFRFRKNGTSAPLSEKQYSYIYSKLYRKMNQYYEINTELEEKFKQKLEVISKKRASGLIFALKYSTKSLWIRWELQNLIGPDKKAQAQLKKKSQIENKIRDIESTMARVSI